MVCGRARPLVSAEFILTHYTGATQWPRKKPSKRPRKKPSKKLPEKIKRGRPREKGQGKLA
jgi:hypothetical protein